MLVFSCHGSICFQKGVPADDIFTASTQTAVVLAELAVDTDDPLSQTTDDLNATGFLIEEDTFTLEVSFHWLLTRMIPSHRLQIISMLLAS